MQQLELFEEPIQEPCKIIDFVAVLIRRRVITLERHPLPESAKIIPMRKTA